MLNDTENPNSESRNPKDAWRWEVVDQIDSTNRAAQERVLACWARGESADRVALRAVRQSAGRGQHGRRWESPAGGLYMSVVFEDVPTELRGRLALIAGIAVMEALRERCPEAGALQLRWPNDVLMGGKKLAGILCEAVAQGERWAAIVGVGVNVATPVSALPEELRGTSATLAGVGAPLDLDLLAQVCADGVAHWINMTQEFGIAGLVQCIAPMDALRGKRVRLEIDGRVVEGTGAGLAPDGALLIRKADGGVEAFERGTLRRSATSF